MRSGVHPSALGGNGLPNRRHLSRLSTVLVFLLSAQVTLIGSPIARAATGGSVPVGVHVDPGSSAAKQYAIPLASARGAPPGTTGSGILFGAGISRTSSKHQAAAPSSTAAAPSSTAAAPSSTAAAGNSTAGAAASTPRSGTGATAPGSKRQAVPGTEPSAGAPRTIAAAPRTRAAVSSAASAPPPAAKILHSGSGSGLLWMVVMAALVLALGAAGSFAITGRKRGTPSAG